jgi:hypothetical protein
MTDDWDHHLEEYKLCEEARHHHERTMWQLLGFYLAVTGVLLNFWLAADPFTEVAQRSNSFLILFIPLFLGIFTAGALLKHKFFWRLELRRAVELEKLLDFKRERAFLKELYSRPLRFLRSGEMAFLAVALTVLGVGYLIGRSLWFKLPTAPGGHFWFPIFMAALPAGLSAYGAYRIWQVDRERHLEEGAPRKVRGLVSRVLILLGIAIGFLGSLLLWWSLELAMETSGLAGTVEWFWLGLWQTEVSLILLGLLFGMSVYSISGKRRQSKAGHAKSTDSEPLSGKHG